MNLPTLKQVIVATTVGLLSLSLYADQTSEAFQTECVSSWMKKAEGAANKVDYKNFGEKYCGCAAKQPLDNDAAIHKAIQLCISRTLLHDAMDSLEEEIGLNEAKDKDINEYCTQQWHSVKHM